MRSGGRGWPKDSLIKTLSQWIISHGYKSQIPDITEEYLYEIVEVYREMHQGENPTKTSGGEIYVRDSNGGYVPNGDTFEGVSASMRSGGRGWPKDSPIKSLLQWLIRHGYKSQIPDITEEYLCEIVGVYREMHQGKNPTAESDAIYVRDVNGGYVANGDTFAGVRSSMRRGHRGWKDSSIKSLPQWIAAQPLNAAVPQVASQIPLAR
jgi:uncharacterized Zn ribbon protein